jgi:2-(1,2-epoxy-1,2-dihydrophenyl)acetyl-CoA isomerase
MTTTATKYEAITVEERDHVAIVKLNRPEKLNAWAPAMQTDIISFVDRLNEGEYDVRAIVLSGEGRAFCAGGDVTGFPGADLEAKRPPWRRAHGEAYAIRHLRDCDAPVIGAINGYAVGMGFGLALSTDLRIAADDAIFQVAQTKRGIIADFGLGYFLPKIVGAQRGLELMFTGRRIDAQEALDLGLVLEVVPRDDLMDRSIELASEIAKGPPLSMAAVKRLVYMIEEDDLARVQDLTSPFVNIMFKTDDGIEGVKSFMERREPVFTGR